VVSAASTLVRFSGLTPLAAAAEVSIARIRLFDKRAWIAYRPDEHETLRRRRCGMEAIVELDLLDALMDLPAGIPVPLTSLRAADRRLLRRVPVEALDWGGESVTRRAVPPLMPMLAIVRAAEWQDGLEAASRFASYCRRLVLLPELPADPDIALAQASFYGIGVAVARGAIPGMVLEPEPFTDWHPTPAWWSFTEKIHRQLDQANR
jgi:hypothetical protein